MRVNIDGTDYVPSGAYTPRVGIAITTRNRHEVFRDCLAKVRALTPDGVPIIVVDDASEPAVEEADVRFEYNVGIPKAKNACLTELLNLGCEYLILLDNDCYPIRADWIDVFCGLLDEHKHLSAQFKDLKSGGRHLGDIEVIYSDDLIEAWTGQRGYCLAYHRSAIESVGGFDFEAYGAGLFEHSDLANRLFAAGMTNWRYASPKDSHLLVESLDQSLSVERTPLPGRNDLVRKNAEIHNRRRRDGYSAYVEPREQYDVVLTCLYTGRVDPQRGVKMNPDAAALAALAKSVHPHRLVVLHDELSELPHTYDPSLMAELVKAPNTVNVYFQRWINALQYLEVRPEIRHVLVCDGTDVEILQPDRLFDSITPGTVKVGSEFQVVGCKWLRENHPDKRVQEWIEVNKDRQLLNAGVLLGGRDDVIRFIRRIVQVWADIEMDEFHKTSAGNGVGDMAVFNMVGYELGAEFGPHVTTLFKGEQGNDFSLVRHK